MAIRYVDLLNGNDANAGTSFAARKKTINSASTGLAAGDTIRVMKSSDPTSLGSCTWSSSTRTVILPQAATAHINVCDSGWTASANITATYPTTSTDLKYGTNVVQLAVATAFTTGKIAYAPCATVDLSPYQQISLFFRNSAAITANQIYIDLCSDATGDVPVVSFALPPKGTQSLSTSPFTFNYGANLPSNINSIAIRAASDPGTPNLIFDHIIACKATSSADSLTLNSIIGLNTADEPEWFPIKSINGTTVELDIYSNWAGSTGSLTTYKMEPIRFQDIFGTGTAFPAGANSGAYTNWSSTINGTLTGGYLNIEFGWDTVDMSTQNGKTAVDFHIYSGLASPTGDYIHCNNLIAIRCNLLFSGSSNAYSYGEIHCPSLYNLNWTFGSGNGVNLYFDKMYVTSVQASATAAGFELVKGNILSVKYTSFSTGALPLSIGGAINFEVKNLYSYGFQRNYFNALFGGSIYNFYTHPGSVSVSSVGAIYGIYTNLKIVNAYMYGTWTYLYQIAGNNFTCSIANLILSNPINNFVYMGSNFTDNNLYVQNYNNTGAFRGQFEYGTLKSTTTDVHTAGGVAWELVINTSSFYKPLTGTEWYRVQNQKIADIPVKANKLTTIKIWTKRLFTTTQGALFVKPTIPGVTDYVVATSSAAAGTWEQLTITFTPTINTVIDLYIGAQYDATNAGQAFYFDDLSVTIAD